MCGMSDLWNVGLVGGGQTGQILFKTWFPYLVCGCRGCVMKANRKLQKDAGKGVGDLTTIYCCSQNGFIQHAPANRLSSNSECKVAALQVVPVLGPLSVKIQDDLCVLNIITPHAQSTRSHD